MGRAHGASRRWEMGRLPVMHAFPMVRPRGVGLPLTRPPPMCLPTMRPRAILPPGVELSIRPELESLPAMRPRAMPLLPMARQQVQTS